MRCGDEESAFKFLLHIGFAREQIIYEPDGNVPPDFLVESEIAVEVRRLNYQICTHEGKIEGVEQLVEPLLRRFSKLLETFGESKDCPGWWVELEFHRPLAWHDWQSVARRELASFLDRNVETSECTFHLSPNFKLALRRRQSTGPVFEIAEFDDKDSSSGWVVSDLASNIALSVQEKTLKIERYRSRYPKWWLILVDHITYGRPQSISVPHTFDKVIIIHPNCFGSAYEVSSVSV